MSAHTQNRGDCITQFNLIHMNVTQTKEKKHDTKTNTLLCEARRWNDHFLSSFLLNFFWNSWIYMNLGFFGFCIQYIISLGYYTYTRLKIWSALDIQCIRQANQLLQAISYRLAIFKIYHESKERKRPI